MIFFLINTLGENHRPHYTFILRDIQCMVHCGKHFKRYIHSGYALSLKNIEDCRKEKYEHEIVVRDANWGLIRSFFLGKKTLNFI